jgi:hypothetical protein
MLFTVYLDLDIKFQRFNTNKNHDYIETCIENYLSQNTLINIIKQIIF